MKKVFHFFLLIPLVFSCKGKTQEGLVTHPTQFVFDYSKMFSEDEKDSLNQKLKQYELKTTKEVAIVTKDSISGDIVLYSVNLANEMGIGKKDKDNGLLILLVKNSKQLRISTGLGTEKVLTDSICLDIINKQMMPEFKMGNFYKGIDNALDEIIIKWKNE